VHRTAPAAQRIFEEDVRKQKSEINKYSFLDYLHFSDF